jgi:hypothetical protein
VLPDANANGVRIFANAGGLNVDGAANGAVAICRKTIEPRSELEGYMQDD